MFKRMLSACLVAATALTALPASARPDDEHRERRQKRDDREDRAYWRERDKAEREYWKEQDREASKHEAHRYESDDDDDDDDDRDEDRASHRHYRAPAWMEGYWDPSDTQHYVALVPGDPSRCYVFIEGRWMLRQIRDTRARVDLEGAFRLPVAAPPVAPPRLGLNFHIVLFN